MSLLGQGYDNQRDYWDKALFLFEIEQERWTEIKEKSQLLLLDSRLHAYHIEKMVWVYCLDSWRYCNCKSGFWLRVLWKADV